MRNLKRILFPIFVIVVFLLIQQFEPKSVQSSQDDAPPQAAVSSTTSSPAARIPSTNALIVRAVDGDTLVAKLDGSTEEVKVRLLGVNTPESVDPRRPVQCFGKEASKFIAQLVDGKRVQMDPDLEADEVDKYGRLLRNVILEDGIDVNAELIRAGYAYAYVDFPQNKQRKVFLKHLQDEAERQQLGLWNPTTCNGKK